jgi:hypothetical protein
MNSFRSRYNSMQKSPYRGINNCSASQICCLLQSLYSEPHVHMYKFRVYFFVGENISKNPRKLLSPEWHFMIRSFLDVRACPHWQPEDTQFCSNSRNRLSCCHVVYCLRTTDPCRFVLALLQPASGPAEGGGWTHPCRDVLAPSWHGSHDPPPVTLWLCCAEAHIHFRFQALCTTAFSDQLEVFLLWIKKRGLFLFCQRLEMRLIELFVNSESCFE